MSGREGRGVGGLIRSRGCETKIFILSLKKGRKGGRERVEALFRFALLCFVAEVFYRLVVEMYGRTGAEGGHDDGVDGGMDFRGSDGVSSRLETDAEVFSM